MAQAESGPRADARPLSPHLQIYSPLINMVMSILHRITGAALYFGTLIVVVWLVAAASGVGPYLSIMGLIKTPVGQIVLVGYTWALIHHALGGIRHFIWDTGRGFELGTVNFMCWMSIIGSLAITSGIWAFIFKLRGLL
jgi:succinate dehydrogenase / fumarate reductase, cytochrome b subunit